MDLREKTKNYIAETFGIAAEEIEKLLERPPRPEMGDLAMPCFKFAKELRKSPQAIAQEFSEKMSGDKDFLDKVVAEGPYLNFFYNRSAYAENIFSRAENAGDKLLAHQAKEPEGTVLVDYSSPNIAKPFHVGHGFSTCLGDAICKLYRYQGYDVKGLNHLGDYGTQFGRLIYGWKHWGDDHALEQDAIKELTRVYIKFHEEAEEHEDLYEAAREHFRRLENGEEEELQLWQRFKDVSIKEFERLYKRLDISFDSYKGEAFYSDMIPEVVQILRDQGLLVESQGAEVVNLDEFKLNPCIIIKSDGSSIYATRDLAAILYRDRTWDFYRNIYVVGQDQSYHFEQLFAVLKKMGHPKADNCFHVGFGRISSGDEEFSTRHGKIILLEDFLDETYHKVLEIMSDGNFDMSDEERSATAEAIAVASVKFLYLKAGRDNNIAFTWEEMLDFNGDTAPYILYSYARARSILRRAEAIDLSSANFGLLTNNEEFNLLKELESLEGAALEAMSVYEPSILVRQILKLVRSFNRYYQAQPILKEENEELRNARLALCQLFTKELKTALAIIGINVVERM